MHQKSVFVKQIKAGDQVNESFLVTEKNMTFSQKGAPYLSLRLRDKTGEIEGRIWDRVAELDPVFKKGDVIHIQSRAASFKNSLQLSIVGVKKIERQHIDPADYSPISRSDIQEMFSELTRFIGRVENPHLKGLLRIFRRRANGEPIPTGAGCQVVSPRLYRRAPRTHALRCPNPR